MEGTSKPYTDAVRDFYIEERKRIWNSRYIPTLIPGLDKLLRGGLVLPHNTNSDDVENIVILIKGQAGTGKTTLATQIMLGIYYYLMNVEEVKKTSTYGVCKNQKPDFIEWIKSVEVRKNKFEELKREHLYPIVYSCEQTGEEFQTYLNRFISILNEFADQDRDAGVKEKMIVPNPKLIVTRTLKVRKPVLYKTMKNKTEIVKKDKNTIGTILAASLTALQDQLNKHLEVIKTSTDDKKKYLRIRNKYLPTLEHMIQLIDDLETSSLEGSTMKNTISSFNELSSSIPESAITIDAVSYVNNVDSAHHSVTLIKGEAYTLKQNYITMSTELYPRYLECIEAEHEVNVIEYWLANVLKKHLQSQKLGKLMGVGLTNPYNKLVKTLQKNPGHKNNATYLQAIEVTDASIDRYLNDYFCQFIKTDVNKEYSLQIIEDTRSFSAWKDDLESFLFANFEKDKPHPVVLVDGLNSFSEHSRRSLDTQKIIRKLRERARFSIIVYEDDKQHYENLDYLADIVIQLKGEVVNRTPNYYLNNLMIEKSRFQQSVLGWHQYKIRSNGFEVFPSLNFRTHRLDKLTEFYKTSQSSLRDLAIPDNKDNAPCSSSSIIHRTTCFTCDNYGDQKHIAEQLKVHLPEKPPPDTQITTSTHFDNFLEFILQSKIKYGSSIAVLGPRHSFKLQSTLDFLRTGSRNNEAGLIVSLLDSDRSLEKDRKSLCKWLCTKGDGRDKCTACYEHVYVLHLRPGCITPEEFMTLLENRLIDGAKAGKPIRRLLFWDLVHLESRFPFFVDDPLFLPALIDYLRYHWAITVVFVGPSNSKMANHVASLVSNLIFTWRDTLKKTQDNTTGNKVTKGGQKKGGTADEDNKITSAINTILENKPNLRNDFYSFYSSAIEGSPSQSSFTFFLRGLEGTGVVGKYHCLQDSIQSIHQVMLKPDGKNKDKNAYIAKFSEKPEWFENALNMRKRIWELQGLSGAIDIEGVVKIKRGE